MADSSSRLVAVIGAGFAGLACARRCLEAGLDVIVFERAAHLGGLWHYDANPNVPSVYASLTAATTAVEMALPGSPFECRDTHPGHVAVMGYLQEFATRHKIKPCIRYRSDVTMLERRDGRWVLTVVDLDINVPMEVVADAVAVCVGHHSVARTLSDKDIPGLSSFTGRQMHSSQYRTPASVSQQNVLVVGMGTSGMEIVEDISSVAQSVTACSMRLGISAGTRSPRTLKKKARSSAEDGSALGSGLAALSSVRVRIKRIRGAEVFFEDSTSLKPDVIIWCTGFQYALPFCPPSLVRVVTGRGEDAPGMLGPRVELYQHMWPVQESTVAFLGLPTVAGSLHPLLDLQSRLFARVVTKQCELPKLVERERWRTAKRAQWAMNADASNHRPLHVEAKTYAHEMLGLMGLVDEVWEEVVPPSRSRSNSLAARPPPPAQAAPAPTPLSPVREERFGAGGGHGDDSSEEVSSASSDPMVSRPLDDDAVAAVATAVPMMAPAPLSAAASSTAGRPSLSKSQSLKSVGGAITSGASSAAGPSSPVQTRLSGTLTPSSPMVARSPLSAQPHSSAPSPTPILGRDVSSSKLAPIAKRTPTRPAASDNMIGTLRNLVAGDKRAGFWDADEVRRHRNLWNRSLAPLMVPNPSSAACGEQGKRDTMEDTHVLLDKIPGVPDAVASGFWAVYDGHGGDEVSRMAEQMLHVRFQKMLIQALLLEGKAVDDVDVGRLLRKCFKETDKAIHERLQEKGMLNVGCTAAVCVLLGRRLFVANCGDSEIVVASSAGAIEMSVKHKPRAESEKLRIETLGGMVFGGRVYGTLSVARGFGDIAYKPPVTPQYIVCPDPAVKCIHLTPEHRFVILACDGLWDKITHAEAAQFVMGLSTADYSLQECAQWLVHEADDRISRDNITVVVVDLQWSLEAGLQNPRTCTECSALTFGVSYCSKCGLPWGDVDPAERQAPSVKGKRAIPFKPKKKKGSQLNASASGGLEISMPTNVKHEASGRYALQDSEALAALLERSKEVEAKKRMDLASAEQ